MILKSLYLKNFRNYRETRHAVDEKKNIITGENGQGKTNLLEAIHVLCSSHSQRGSRDAYMIRVGQSFFLTEGTFVDSNQNVIRVSVSSSLFHQMKIKIDGFEHQKACYLMRRIGVMTLTPEDARVTQGCPFFRRRYIDSLLTKLDGNYVSKCRNISA